MFTGDLGSPIKVIILFRLDKIFTYKSTPNKFNQVRPNYNPNGDKSMVKVLLNAKF